MKRNYIAISLVLLLSVFCQTVVSQSIIMGSQPLVGNIDDFVRDFYDPGGVPGDMGANADSNGYFASNLRDTMTLRVNMSNSVLYALFEEFAMTEGDTLWIFDGPDCQSPLIGAYNLVNSPGELFASGKNMTFVFHSDAVDIPGLTIGWVAKVYAYDTLPNSVNFGDGYIYNTTCLAEFYDSGGPTGNIASNNENSSGTTFVNFTSPIGTHIKCVFSQFSVNGILKIYDGQYADPNKRLIGQFCTSTLNTTTNNMPPVLFSSGNTLSFVYVGGSNDVSKAGWHATISCVAELFEAPNGSACPSITISPAGSYENSPNYEIIDFDCSNPIVMLEASVTATGRYTNDYTVKQLPYNENNMLFGYNEGTLIPAQVDDDWIANQQLPFTFIFFGQAYTHVYPGANGLISFNPQTVGSSCAWSTTVPQASPPYSSMPYNYANCIYGVYEDIYPGHYLNPGGIRYGVLGEYPCRTFVFNYQGVGLYSCYTQGNNMYNTYQMIMYEGTNIIDIYIKHRANCSSWNGGRGVIGLQNKTSSQILTAPGRDFNTSWSADNEAWRFTPITPYDENAQITWYINAVADTNVISFDPHAKNTRIAVSPSETTNYICEYKYHNAINEQFVLRDTIQVRVRIPDLEAKSNTGTNNICPNEEAILSCQFTNYPQILPEHYLWSSGDTTATSTVTPTETSTYYVTVTFDNGCTRTDSVKVFVTDLQLPTITGDSAICQGKSGTLTATHPTSNSFHWSSGQTTSSITVSPQITTDYTVTATMEGDCEVTDMFTVTVMPLPVPSFMANPTEIYVENSIGTVTCTSIMPGGYHLVWNFGDVFSNVNVVEDVDEVTHDYTHAGYYTITLTASDSSGCVDSIKTRVSVEVPYFFFIPNAFTPDGDGVNETFAPKGEGVDPDQYFMQIFDRSGMLIYSTHNPYDYWDGRTKFGQMCPEGVYVYLIRLVNLNGEDKEYTGTVTLVK